MSFMDFVGNRETVDRLRSMLQRDRFPHAVILSGPAGSGKYALAQMLAKTMNCLQSRHSEGLPDYCGTCESCQRIAEADALDTRVEEAIEARENLRETDKRETRLFVQTHPDVIIVPPDPPQNMIKVDQVRRVRDTIYSRPQGGKRKVYIFTNSAFMKESANALLKVLEEPPEYATLFLLTTNAGELLPTLRSRSIEFALAPLPQDEIEKFLAMNRRELTPQRRALVARLSGGAIGSAKRFDIEQYLASRTDALTMLRTAILNDEHSDLFRTTDGYRSGGDGRTKTETLLATLYGLLEDLLFVHQGTPDLARNTDIVAELARLAANIDFQWIAAASRAIGEMESGMRRNLLRSLSLDSMVIAIEK